MRASAILAYDGKDNIRQMWYNATLAEHVAGVQWYDAGVTVARALASTYGYSAEQCVAVLAVLSPSVPWEQNCKAAEICCRTHKLGMAAEDVTVVGYGPNKVKAWRILDGEPPVDVLGGNKVRAFYANLSGNTQAVTVDRHAFSIWLGTRYVSKVRLTNACYEYIAQQYQNVAESLGVPPAVLQATTWCVYRRLHGIDRESL